MAAIVQANWVAAGWERAKTHTRERRNSVKAALQRRSSSDKPVVAMATLTTSQTEGAPVVMATTLEVIRNPSNFEARPWWEAASSTEHQSSTELQSIALQPVQDDSDDETKVRDIMTKQVDDKTKAKILATCAWGELTWAQRLVHCKEVLESPPDSYPDAAPPIFIQRLGHKDSQDEDDRCCACIRNLDDDCADIVARLLTGLCFSAILVPLCFGCVMLFLSCGSVGYPSYPAPPMPPPYLDEVPLPPLPPTAPAPPFAPGEHPTSAGRGLGWGILRFILCGIGYFGCFIFGFSQLLVIVMTLGIIDPD